MAVSGTYNFNLDIDEVIQEASEMIGGEKIPLVMNLLLQDVLLILCLRIGRIEAYYYGLQELLL